MNSNSSPRLRLLGAVLALAAAVALTGLLARSDTAFAQTFGPCLVYVDGFPNGSAAGANTDIKATFGVGIGADCQALPADPSDPPDLQFGATVNFTPPEWGVYRDADMPDGALVARLSSIAQLGLIGNGCGDRLNPIFDMMDATTDQSTTIPFFDPEKESDPEDTEDHFGNEPDDQFDIGADGLPMGVTRFPVYLTRILEDESGNPLQPITRLYGQTEVAGIEVSLNFVIFEPGVVFKTRAGEVRYTDPRMGYPSVTVLQAAGDPDTEPDIEDNNSVNDFCSPLQADTTVYGVSQDNPDTAANEGGIPVRTNPPDGTYNFVTYAVSQRDADLDGIENGLDPCPTVPNPNWNPRLKVSDPAYTGDADMDSLPDEEGCDPDPNEPSHLDSGGVHDEDFDRYGNRGDNCPLVANSAGQLGGKSEPPAAPDDNQDDADLDGIGDACDPNPTNPDTEGGVSNGGRFEVCMVVPVTIGAGGPAPDPAPQNMRPCDPNAPLPTSGTPTPTPKPTPVETGAQLAEDIDATQTSFAVTDCTPFSAGDLISIDDETMEVVSCTNGVMTVVRGVEGTTAAAHESGAEILRLGTSGTPTPTPSNGDIGPDGPSDTGVGSLAPVASSIPTWASIMSALGGAGLLGSLGTLAARIFGIRLPGRRD